MPKRVSEKVEPKDLFRRGESFWNLTRFLGAQRTDVLMNMAFAFVVAHAFACEAFFKVLAQLEKRVQPLETHNLRHLFNDLTPETQARVSMTWEERHLAGIQGEKFKRPSFWKAPQSFGEALDKCAKAFVDWRYASGTEEKPLYFHLMGLATILREIIVEKRPDFPAVMKSKLFDPEADFVKSEEKDLGVPTVGGAILNRQPPTFEIKVRRSSNPKDGSTG